MLSFCLSLPSYRLKISLAKRKHFRGEKDFISSLKSIFAIRRGSRFSRAFRHIFEHKRIKTILGGNLALFVLISSVFSPSVSALATISQTEVTTLSPGITELTTRAGFRPPLDQIKITQGYHLFHPAIDFDGLTGDPVYPITEGRVEAVVFDRWALGNHIIVNHGSGLKSVYAHLAKIEVGVGDKVETNQVIGKIGASGMAFGDHLHLEVLENDRHINPLTIFPAK